MTSSRPLTLGSVLLAGALLAGCTAVVDAVGQPAGGTASTATVALDPEQDAAAVLAANADIHITPIVTSASADLVTVSLAGDTARVSGTDAADAVTVSGSTVTITSPGVYSLSGELSDGRVVVDTADDGIVQLILDGVDISSSTSSPLTVLNADEAIVVLAGASVNTLSDTSGYAEGDEAGAALHSESDLTIAGSGTLEVTGNANDAIASTDGLVIDGGVIVVDAVDDGIRGKDYLVITGGDLVVTAGGDALKSDNEDDATMGFVAITGGTVAAVSGDDGIQAETDVVITGGGIDLEAAGGHLEAVAGDASAKGVKGGVIVVVEGGEIVVDAADDAVHSDGSIRIGGGALELASGDDAVHAESELLIDGGSIVVTASVEGLEAAQIEIADGDIAVVASDDAINAAGGTGGTGGTAGWGQGVGGAGDSSLTISGGTIVLDAGGDGLDSNGALTISGGTIVVNGPTSSGNGAIDADGTITVSGGTLLAAGSAGMAQTPGTTSTQGWLSATIASGVQAGQIVHIVSASGDTVAVFEARKPLQSIVFSSPDIADGENYALYLGGEIGEELASGLAASGDRSTAVLLATVTAGEGASGGMAGAGGFGGGPGGGSGRP